MRQGRRLQPSPSLEQVRGHACAQLKRLPPALRRLTQAPDYPVAISPALRALAAEADRRAERGEAG